MSIPRKQYYLKSMKCFNVLFFYSFLFFEMTEKTYVYTVIITSFTDDYKPRGSSWARIGDVQVFAKEQDALEYLQNHMKTEINEGVEDGDEIYKKKKYADYFHINTDDDEICLFDPLVHPNPTNTKKQATPEIIEKLYKIMTKGEFVDSTETLSIEKCEVL